MDFSLDLASIGHFVERAPAGPFCFKPRWLLRSPHFGRSIFYLALGALRGGGIEKTLAWRGSERHISCGVFQSRDGHLVEGAPAGTFFLVGVAKSPNYTLYCAVSGIGGGLGGGIS